MGYSSNQTGYHHDLIFSEGAVKGARDMNMASQQSMVSSSELLHWFFSRAIVEMKCGISPIFLGQNHQHHHPDEIWVVKSPIKLLSADKIQEA